MQRALAPALSPEGQLQSDAAALLRRARPRAVVQYGRMFQAEWRLPPAHVRELAAKAVGRMTVGDRCPDRWMVWKRHPCLMSRQMSRAERAPPSGCSMARVA